MKIIDKIRKHKKVDELIVTDDIFVYLVNGYHLDGAHCFGEDSFSDVLKTLARVEKCTCANCTKYALNKIFN